VHWHLTHLHARAPSAGWLCRSMQAGGVIQALLVPEHASRWGLLVPEHASRWGHPGTAAGMCTCGAPLRPETDVPEGEGVPAAAALSRILACALSSSFACSSSLRHHHYHYHHYHHHHHHHNHHLNQKQVQRCPVNVAFIAVSPATAASAALNYDVQAHRKEPTGKQKHWEMNRL